MSAKITVTRPPQNAQGPHHFGFRWLARAPPRVECSRMFWLTCAWDPVALPGCPKPQSMPASVPVIPSGRPNTPLPTLALALVVRPGNPLHGVPRDTSDGTKFSESCPARAPSAQTTPEPPGLYPTSTPSPPSGHPLPRVPKHPGLHPLQLQPSCQRAPWASSPWFPWFAPTLVPATLSRKALCRKLWELPAPTLP